MVQARQPVAPTKPEPGTATTLLLAVLMAILHLSGFLGETVKHVVPLLFGGLIAGLFLLWKTSTTLPISKVNFIPAVLPNYSLILFTGNQCFTSTTFKSNQYLSGY